METRKGGGPGATDAGWRVDVGALRAEPAAAPAGPERLAAFRSVRDELRRRLEVLFLA